MPNTPACDIIVLVWNHLEYTRPCIESVLKHTKLPCQLIIVDNDSNEETKQYLKGIRSTENVSVTLITNEGNLGFVGGNNVGLRASEAAFACILNNDTVVSEGWLSEMIKVAEAEDRIGIVNPGSSTFGGRPGPDAPDFVETGSAIGFCMLIKRAVIEKIGYLDESLSGFFFEDTDYSYRAKEAGFICGTANRAYVHHHEHKSVENLRDRQARFNESRKRFYQKWGRPLRIMVAVPQAQLHMAKDVYLQCLDVTRMGNFVDFIMPSENGKSPGGWPPGGLRHADLRTLVFPRRYFGLRCLWRMLVRKKRYDVVVCAAAAGAALDKEAIKTLRRQKTSER